ARGGGFIAMDILHHFGIQGDKKGVLKERNGIDEFNSADGSYKEAIKKVLEYIELSKIVEKNINQGNFAFTSDSTEFATQTKVRINQGVLRKIVLKDYDQQCALCSIDKPNLLICSHIKPWAIDSDNRLNPSNAICLCVLHDALFDKGYIGLNKDYKI
ncbi:HNH endonuclease, partial [Salmonella enterica subsp. enterica serovar Typhi]|nr:HNH endonuclease [Salmonella enterica subsp. enterica serovar Typhi]